MIQINYFNEYKKSIDDLPSGLKNTLYPFQKKGVAFGLKKCGRILIGDEMGVGKTIQAIALSYLYKENWPVLIICPTSLKFNWRAEILRWIGEDGLEANQIQIISSQKDSFYKISKYLIGKWLFSIFLSVRFLVLWIIFFL